MPKTIFWESHCEDPTLRCPACGCDDRDEGQCAECACDEEFVHQQVAFVSVALYWTDRSYGGPEEGGWYYTSGHVDASTIRCFPVAEAPQAALYADWLRDQHADCDDPHSVRVTSNRVSPSHFPETRPYYC